MCNRAENILWSFPALGPSFKTRREKCCMVSSQNLLIGGAHREKQTAAASATVSKH